MNFFVCVVPINFVSENGIQCEAAHIYSGGYIIVQFFLKIVRQNPRIINHSTINRSLFLYSVSGKTRISLYTSVSLCILPYLSLQKEGGSITQSMLLAMGETCYFGVTTMKLPNEAVPTNIP